MHGKSLPWLHKGAKDKKVVNAIANQMVNLHRELSERIHNQPINIYALLDSSALTVDQVKLLVCIGKGTSVNTKIIDSSSEDPSNYLDL